MLESFIVRRDVVSLLRELLEKYAAVATSGSREPELVLENTRLKEEKKQLAVDKKELEAKIASSCMAKSSLRTRLDALMMERGSVEAETRRSMCQDHQKELQAAREQHIRLQDRLEQSNALLKMEVDKLSLMSANSTRKGACMEETVRLKLEETLGIEVEDMSKTPQSMDLCVKLSNSFEVFVDTKNYKGTLPIKEVVKFERDRQRLKSSRSTAKGFLLMCRNQIPSSLPATLIASNLYAYKKTKDTYIVTGNSGQALFQALISIARCSEETPSTNAGGGDGGLTIEFKKILKRIIPLFQNNHVLVNRLETTLKEYKSQQTVDAAALSAQLDECERSEDLEDVLLLKSVGHTGSKRKRLNA